MPGPYTYFNNIPQPNDDPSVSQGQLLANFGSLSSWVNIDHVDFASPDAGKHAKVTFPVQGATPVFSGTEYGLFNQLDPFSATNQIYLSNPVTGQQVPFALSNLNTIGTTGVRNGYFYLPCGFLVKFGTINSVTNGVNPYNLPVVDASAAAIPAFTTKLIFVAAWPIVVSGTPIISATQQGTSLTQISIYNSSGTTLSVSFVAIGY